MKIDSEDCKILDNIKVSEDGYVMTLKTVKFENKFSPGNFLQLKCSEENTVLRRPFSILEETDGHIKLYFKVVGRGTHWLSNRKNGETVNIIAPIGNSFTVQEEKRVLLIGGGCGISPLLNLSFFLSKKQSIVDALFGFRNEKDYPGMIVENRKKELNNLWITLDETNKKEYNEGTTIDYLKKIDIDTYDVFYCCGPVKMLKKLSDILKDKWAQVSLEARMGCGIGICYGCSIKTTNGSRRVCNDGPVFNLNEVIWDEL